MAGENPLLFRARLLRAFRNLLDDLGFVEFGTPVIRKYRGATLVPRPQLSNGANLRESPAFALRRNLAVADRIFEIGPCFRPDDPADATHLPEFTMLDLYWRGAELAAVSRVAERLVGSVYPGPIERISLAGLLDRELGLDLLGDTPPDQVRRRLAERYGAPEAREMELLNRFLEDEVEPRSEGKCLVVEDFPISTESRARLRPGSRCIGRIAEFLVDGVEVVQMYADEPDPAAFASRAAREGDFGPEDQVMCELLKCGAVPPESAGFGIGIERLVMVCLGLRDIREVVASPEFSLIADDVGRTAE